MSAQSTLMRYRNLLQEKAELQKRDLDLAVEIRVCEKQMEIDALLANAGQHVETSETERFIDQYRNVLEEDQIEFLQQEYRRTGEVAEYLGVSNQTVNRRGDAGIYDFKTTGGKHRLYQTVSVIRTLLLDAQAEEEK